MDKNNYYSNHDVCFLARILLEAETPIKIGSGKDSVKTDAIILRDVNGLPYIPGATLMGLMRHALGEDTLTANRIMGFQSKKTNDGHGSWLSVSEAKVVGKGNVPVDGLQPSLVEKDEYLSGLMDMPIRQHVRIGHKGVAEKAGKFDEEVIPKGVRFCFEMELLADGEQGERDFLNLLDALQDDTFRIGGGSRKGFGKMRVEEKACRLDFNDTDQFQIYLDKPSALNDLWDGWEKYSLNIPKLQQKEGIVEYTLDLYPCDFMLFSAGLQDTVHNIDKTVIREKSVQWSSDQTPQWVEEGKTIVVPASSVKGAIAHRTAFYYNLGKGVFADRKTPDEAEQAGRNNEAVTTLFGSAGDDKGKGKRRGRVLFSDIVETADEEEHVKGKVFNHVRIDRFTGGAVNGALFDEAPLYTKGHRIVLHITLTDAGHIGKDVRESFEHALNDICSGLLPLGGGVNRGNGMFTGELKTEEK